MDNPYSGVDFFGFLKVLFCRLITFDFTTLAADEVQLLVLIGVSLSGALVGTFLVLRNMTMVANALSHTILVGIVGAYLLLSSSLKGGWDSPSLLHLTLASLIAGLLTTFLIEFFHKVTDLHEDASVGLVFTTLFAVGVVLVTLFTKNLHLGTELVMGNVDACQAKDLKIVFGLFLLNASLFFLFFKEFQVTTFDAGLSQSLGLSPQIFNGILMIVTSATTMCALQAVGVLMVLSFLVGPTLIARCFVNRLSSLLFLSCGIGILASLLSVALSRHLLSTLGWGLSTSGLVVCVILLLFILTLFKKRLFSAFHN